MLLLIEAFAQQIETTCDGLQVWGPLHMFGSLC